MSAMKALRQTAHMDKFLESCGVFASEDGERKRQDVYNKLVKITVDWAVSLQPTKGVPMETLLPVCSLFSPIQFLSNLFLDGCAFICPFFLHLPSIVFFCHGCAGPMQLLD